MGEDNKTIKGVITRGGKHIECRSVVLSTGTFLNGECHIGKYHVPAGRFHVPPLPSLHRSATHWRLTLPRSTWRSSSTR